MKAAFNPIKNFEVGNSPNVVAIADFNGDGKQDLVAANQNSNNVSVLLGNDNNDFSPTQNVDVGNAPVSVIVADFNNDGIFDLATANQGDFGPEPTDGNVSVLLGDGTGGFSPAQNFDVGNGNSPISLATGDFNGDEISDIVTANVGNPFTAPNERNENISVLLGDGAGGFSAAQNFDVGDITDVPLSVKVGDFNNDGKDDLVTANSGNNISLLLGDGTGGFSTPQKFEAGTGLTNSLTLGDFNGDGIKDLVTINTDTVSLLLGDSNGSFSEAQKLTFEGVYPLIAITAGDFNGDGKDDLATASFESIDTGKISVFLGNGNGSFSEAQNFEVDQPIFLTAGLTARDINNDGKDDLVTTNGFSDQLLVLTTRDNNAPTDLTLSNDTIAENNSFNTRVGTFTTTDPDTNETFTYELVTGEGDTDNSSFSINGDKLIARESFDFETKSSYDIRVKTTDAGDESFEKTLTINVNDLSEVSEIRTVTKNGNEMEVIDLTGNAGQTVIANFEITRDAAYDNNVYFYKVDGDDGNIGSLTPDDNGYLETALNNVVNPDFGLSATQEGIGRVRSFSLTGGDILGIAIVADGTLEQAISNIDSVEGVYLSYMGAGASTDNGTFDHIRFNSTTSTFEFEDLANGGDQDFDDLKIKIGFQ